MKIAETMLLRAARQFRFYQRQHREKISTLPLDKVPDTTRKAQVNGRMAEACIAAIVGDPGPVNCHAILIRDGQLPPEESHTSCERCGSAPCPFYEREPTRAQRPFYEREPE